MFELSPVYIWLIAGLVCLVIELKLPTIGFLFLGLGGLTNAVLVNIYPVCCDYQFISFGLASFVWFLILWYPLKNYVRKSGKHHRFDIIGSEVEVCGAAIMAGGSGAVKWSGAVMNARLEADSEAAEIGEKLIVKSVSGNVLICGKR